MSISRKDLPLVYSCSGCSSAAQMANHIAIRMDRSGEAEMSCIAGVGGNVGPLVKTARSGRPIIAIDGCVLQCAKSCLAQRGVAPDVHVVLSDAGVRKRYHAEFDAAEAEPIVQDLKRQAARLARQRRQARGGEPDAPLVVDHASDAALPVQAIAHPG